MQHADFTWMQADGRWETDYHFDRRVCVYVCVYVCGVRCVCVCVWGGGALVLHRKTLLCRGRGQKNTLVKLSDYRS